MREVLVPIWTPDGLHSSASVLTNVVFCLNGSPSLMSAFQHTPGTRSQPLPALEICQCFFKCEAAAGKRVVQPPAQSMCLSVHVEQVDMCQTGVSCCYLDAVLRRCFLWREGLCFWSKPTASRTQNSVIFLISAQFDCWKTTNWVLVIINQILTDWRGVIKKKPKNLRALCR